MSDVEEAYVEETKVLMEIPEEERVEYVNEVLGGVVDAIKKIMEEKKKVKKFALFKKFMKELDEKGKTIVVCALYSVKREHRKVYVDLMRILVGFEEEVVMPEKKKS